MKQTILLVPAFLLVACSAPQPKVGVENVGKEIVVSSMNDESMPSWVKNSSEKSLYEEDGNVIAVSMNSMPSDTRIDAGFKIGELNAKAAMAKTLESRIEHFAQAASEGFSLGDQTLRTITTESAKITASNMRPGRQYFQKLAVTDSSGTPQLEMRFWTEVTLSKEEFLKAMINATRKTANKPAFTEAFSKQVDQNFKTLVTGHESSPTERVPTENEEQ